ncbi:MAG: AAA family ATPase [Lentimicrobiaceae bacterium]|nr:AAA family ATPase [Lentimicrobiaceae bacterium]MDD7276720.1 AAA family ATPase [Bacteroidales bacterium]MDY6075562.1 AAA family ATPase [Bacteroidales bacterium]
MAKRAYSPKDVANIKHKVLPFEGKWKDVFGEPEQGDTWFISGASASGKSSFVMQLAKMLCSLGNVLYVSLEEGVGVSMQRRLAQFKMNEVQGSFRITTDGDIDALAERLAKPKSAKFIIVDSYQFAFEAGWEYNLTRDLIDRFKHKTFIFISQEDKGKPLGKPAVRLKYKAGVKVRTQGFRAYCQGRYSGNVSEYFTIWEEKAVEVYNEKSND